MSADLKASLLSVSILDSGSNMSDHRAIGCTISIADDRLSSTNRSSNSLNPKAKLFSRRWDKANLNNYYELSRSLLQAVYVPRDCLTVHSGLNDCLQQIQAYYNDIVCALVEASRVTVPEIPCRSLKPFWSSELDKLKQDSIFWHNIWVFTGRPASGELQRIKAACKLKHKHGVKTAYETFERQNNDALYEHFLEKNTSQFWKSWHSRFYYNISKHVVLERMV